MLPPTTCVASNSSNTIVKFEDDTVVIGLITNNDESAYLREVENLSVWCRSNCLSLNVSKTKELIVDYNKKKQRSFSLHQINSVPVERIDNIKYLGVLLTEDLTCHSHVSTLVTRARKQLYHLRRFRVTPVILKTFYSAAVESILTMNITVCFGNCSLTEHKAPQRVIRAAERCVRSPLPSLLDTYKKTLQVQSNKDN